MNVAGLASSSLFALTSLLRSGGSSAADAFVPTQGSAKSAEVMQPGTSILPASGVLQLSLDALLTLQVEAPKAPAITALTAEEKFLAEAQKTPMERMREQVLDDLGLSEGALAQMSPEERRAAEDRIREMIEEKIRQAMGATDAPAETNADMLQGVA